MRVVIRIYMGQGNHVITCDALSAVDHNCVIQRTRCIDFNIVCDMMHVTSAQLRTTIANMHYSCHIPSSLHKAEEVPISLYEPSVSKPPFTICLCFAFALC